MPVAYCGINDAYGPDFGKKKGAATAIEKKKDEDVKVANEKRIAKYGDAPQGQDYKCPHCEKCNEENKKFQQQQLNQAIWPRPRWIPEYAAEQPWDPYSSRYYNMPFGSTGMPFAPMVNGPMIENFGDPWGRVENFNGISQTSAEHLLKLILWLLVALFIIQLVDMAIKLIAS